MAVIIVSNQSNIAKGEIVTIVEDSHQFTHNECMAEWISKGNSPQAWFRTFSLVRVTDKTKSELDYLTEPLYNNATAEREILNIRKWFFIEPPEQSPHYIDLLDSGEVSTMFEECLPYLRERT